MPRWILAVVLIGAAGVLPAPSTADAQDKTLVDCLNEAVRSCDADFEGNDVYMAAVRGYCYMIRGTICYASKEVQ
jgi:hypothetical protein